MSRTVYDSILEGTSLPDEPFVSPHLPPGAKDGLARLRIALTPDTAATEAVADALANLSRRPTVKARRHLESVMRDRTCLDLVDPILEAVRNDARIAPATLYSEVRQLLVESHWREPVKLCIALLGLYRHPEDADLLEPLGRHEEFTLWVAIALGHILADPVPAWLRLAGETRGWGKVHLVRRLVKHADRPQVRAWLLRHGCANAVDDNLLALPIAAECRLHEALGAPDPDPALLEGARHILAGLLAPGPAPGLDAYPQAAQAALLWVSALEDRANRLQEFLTLSGLAAWRGAPAELRERVRPVLESPHWADLVLAHLDDPNPAEAWAAREAARRLGLPVFDRLLAGLEANPGDIALWAYLAAGAAPAQLERLLALAPDPGGEVLSILVRALRRCPGRGGRLLGQALASPLADQRLLALDVLGRWEVAAVPPETALAVMTTARDDPQGVVRKAARVVLKGWKLPFWNK